MKIFLTAPPGVGKSTVIGCVIDDYPASAMGIVAREILDSNRERVGFTSVNSRGALEQFMWKESDPAKATIGGEYSVRVDAIDGFVVPELTRGLASDGDVLLYVDEIGRAQVESKLFVQTIRDILNSDKNVLASIVYDDEPWSREFKNRDDLCLLEVNLENRSDLPAILQSAFCATADFNRLNAVQQNQVCAYLKRFVEGKKFDSAKKLFDNALPYLLTNKIKAAETNAVGEQAYIVQGNTDSHKLVFIEKENRFQCDCPLANGRAPFENKAAICSHEMSVALQRLSYAN